MRRIVLLCALAMTLSTACGQPAPPAPSHAPPTTRALPQFNSVDALLQAGRSAMSGQVSGLLTAWSWASVFVHPQLQCDFKKGPDQHLAMRCADITQGTPTLLIIDEAVYEQHGSQWSKINLAAHDQHTEVINDEQQQLRKYLDFDQLMPQDATIGIATKDYGHWVWTTRDKTITMSYELKTDLNATLTKTTDPAVRQQLQSLIARGITSTHYHLLMNVDNLPTDLEGRLPSLDPAKPDQDLQVFFTDWNKTVDITAPPAGQVIQHS